MTARYVGTAGLMEMVSPSADGTTSVLLLRGRWLAEMGYKRPERLPLRQQLEETCPEAFAGKEMLERCLGEVGRVDASIAKMSFPGVLVLS